MPLALAATLLCTGAARAQVLVPDGFQDRLVVSGLTLPVGMAWLPDGRLLVIEQKSARVRLVVNGALGADLATIDDVRIAHGEQGLLGIAVDPGWPARPYVYVHCDDLTAQVIRVSRYTVTGDLAFSGSGALSIDTGTRYDLIDDIPDVAGNHNGGTLRFGPDGMLYGSFGDDEGRCAAQTPGLRGVILRLDASRLPPGAGGPPPRALIAAPGNPFPAVPDSNALLVWAYGLRNPFRFGIDPANGALLIGDVGQNGVEEVDYAPSGGINFGWPRWEGSQTFDPSSCQAPGAVFPIAEYPHGQGPQSVIGGGIYRRPAGATMEALPASYEGNAFFSDYYTGNLSRLIRDGGGWRAADPVPGQVSPAYWGQGFTFTSEWQFGPDGALWYVRQGSGQIRRVVNTTEPDTAGPQSVAFARPFPIPARGEVNLRFSLAQPARVSLRIYDARGALVRTLVDGVRNAATYDELWLGLDERNGRVANGVFYARLIVDGSEMTRTIPFLRK